MRQIKFIKKDGIIYKWSESQKCWIQMTGIKPGIDRRNTFGRDVEQYGYNKQKARTEINNYWNRVKDSWTYRGHEYNNHTPAAIETKYGWEINPDIPNHTYRHDSYIIVWHQGNLYWAYRNHYLPQVQLFRFIRKSDGPDTLEFTKWTHIKNCKAIFDKTTKKYE